MKKLQQLLKQSWVRIALLVLAVGAGFYFYQQSTKIADTGTQYQTTQAEQGTLIVAVSGSGLVSSANNTSVTTSLGGVIEEVYVKDGDTVLAGTPILKLSLDDESKQRQAQAYASYLSAVNANKQSTISKSATQLDLEKSRQTVLDAAQKVAELDEDLATDRINPATKETYTQNEIDSIRSALTQARSAFAIAEAKYGLADTGIASARASLSAAQLEYANYADVINVPIGGTITNFTWQKGDRIAIASSGSAESANSSSSSSETIAVIKTENNPAVTINVSEIDIPKVKIGDKATLTADAFADATYTGRVTAIDTVGASASGVVTYPVTIVLDVAQDQMFANMTVTANIITMTKTEVLLIPRSAVVPQDESSSVRVMRNGQVELVEVTVGESSDTQTEIMSGISAGDEVVTSSVMNQTTGTNSGATRSVFSTGGFGGQGGNAVRIVR